MMTHAEARQRAAMYNASIVRTYNGYYRCTLNEWTRKEREERSYYTDDLEDAVLTIGHLRRHARNNANV